MATQNRRFDMDPIYNFPARETLVPALKVGALTGTTGLLTGGVSGLLIASKTPTLFALASSIQWFLLGGTFWATRSTILYARSPPIDSPPTRLERIHGVYPTPQDRVQASTFAGGIAGGVISALVRGRRNVLPATLCWTFFGYAGQRLYNNLDARHSDQIAFAAAQEASNPSAKQERGFWNRVAEMKWSPMKTLSNEEYAKMLRERLLGLDAQIALIDEEMERLGDKERAIGEGDGRNVESEAIK